MSAEIIKKAIRTINSPGGFSAPIDRGIVLAVDKSACTCQVQLVSNDAVLDDVLLKPVINEGDSSILGVIIFPAIDSFVTVGQVDHDNKDCFVISFTEIESISLNTSTLLNLLITADGKLNLNAVLMTFNNGDNGGIPLLKPLTDTINKLQKQVNDLIDAFTAHKHPGVSAGNAISLQTVTAAPDKTAPLIKTDDIENKKILQ